MRPFARVVGWLLLVIGAAGLVALGGTDWTSQRYVSRYVITSPYFALVGLSMALRPGSPMTVLEVENGRLSDWWSSIPRAVLMLWVLSAVIGVIGSLVVHEVVL